MRNATLAFLTLMPALALAVSPQDSWDNLNRLAPGQHVRIVLNDAKSHVGQFQSANEAGIAVRLPAGGRTFERQSVLRVSTQGKSHRKRNSLIGLAVGAGAGIGVGVASPELGQGRCAQGSCVNAGSASLAGMLGGVVGSGLGAAIPTGRWQDVYRAR